MNFGQGGRPNSYPRRGAGGAQYGTSSTAHDVPDEFVGGARGPAALPSRTTVANGPARSERLIGADGQISLHRGDFVEDAGAPRLSFDGVLGHGSIAWHRPTYPNVAGREMYRPPTQMPSWSENGAVIPGAPHSPIPVQNKRIGSFTVSREYGSTRQFFDGRSLADFVASIQVGMNAQGRRWLAQARTANPWQPNLSSWGPAGSYGQTTTVLKTAPTTVPASYDQYGAY